MAEEVWPGNKDLVKTLAEEDPKEENWKRNSFRKSKTDSADEREKSADHCRQMSSQIKSWIKDFLRQNRIFEKLKIQDA